MICPNCKKEINNDSTVCESCGAVLGAVTYDYITVSAKIKNEALVIDTYENLGYEKTSYGFNAINFKRSRKLKNKSTLLKVQRKVEKSISAINSYEKKKSSAASISAIIIGIIGTLILGTGFSLIMEYDQMVVGIILGVLGIIVAIPAYPLYKNIFEKKSDYFSKPIEEEYDKIASYCEEAQALLK